MTLDLIEMANGGAAVARGKKKLTIFVPYGIPGEKVRAAITSQKNDHAYAELEQVLRPSPDRIEPNCPHFGTCGGCHFQHMRYEAQLAAKQAVVVDQMERIGNIKHVPVRETLPNATPWGYQVEMSLSPTKDGRLGFWSPRLREIIPIETCPISNPQLLTLLQDIDLELPGLRKMTLRVGADEALLAAVEVNDVEPPLLEADFPISVAIVLPDKTAATLVGDHYIVQSLRGRDFRVSPGCYLPPSLTGMEQVIETVLHYARLEGSEAVLELYSGVGILTASLAEKAATVVAVEQNQDAVADMAVNLDHTDNVAVYEGYVEAVLPTLTDQFDLVIMHPPRDGLSRDMMNLLLEKRPSRIIYISSDVATLARDGRKLLSHGGYKLIEVQPIDMQPQTYHIETVSLWEG
ncbi:MAG: class I SAM-dependent RNA methyltransferase [Anaerolineales bacterium]|nr:class I SAM-dependent RNA methyltransferase [Anaerolineales bacterium]